MPAVPVVAAPEATFVAEALGKMCGTATRRTVIATSPYRLPPARPRPHLHAVEIHNADGSPRCSLPAGAVPSDSS